jgi:protein SPT2
VSTDDLELCRHTAADTCACPLRPTSYRLFPGLDYDHLGTTMASFAALMALSQTQTQQSQTAVQSALAARERKEAQARKEREERDRKEREMDARIRLRKMEEDKRAAEREARLQAEKEARDRVREKREQEERDRIMGMKKARGESGGGAWGRGRRAGDEEGSGGGGTALTREEKRQRKLELDMRESANRRSGGPAGSSSGKRLKGGAIDLIEDSNARASQSHLNARQRLMMMPNTLTKVQAVKRDTRTIDEILRDKADARAKVIAGDNVKEFHDWFGATKKEPAAKTSAPVSGTSSPVPSQIPSESCISPY